MSHRPKRQKFKHDTLLLVEGDDNGTDTHLRQTWDDVVAKGVEWTDEEFPPVQSSISGKEKKKEAESSTKKKKTVNCNCGVNAMKSKVKKPTPNQGREYFHCPARQCPFFAWADGGGSLAKNLAWQRFPGLLVVNDFGFHAEDLRQGGVGDCWFLSALAVVAQRHDLIAKLFVDTTPAKATGCYALNLFLDGSWRTVLIDDKLPVTAAPRRADLAFTSNLAYSRTGSVATGQQQLWVSLLEKAYAKAHGSYQSISGGHIAEALLDLTGAPTISIDFSSHSFSSELLWARLLCCKRLGLPAGCATAGDDPNLKEMGLCGR
jgi:calpain-15